MTSPEPVVNAQRIRSLGYDLAHHDVIGLHVLRWYLPNTRVEWFDSSRRSSPSRYVLCGRGWAREHPATDAVALWRARDHDDVLWRSGDLVGRS